MISLLRLHLPPLRIPRRADLQVIRHLLKVAHQAAPHLPPQATPLPRLILRELPRHLVKLAAGIELRQGKLFLGVFLALGGEYVRQWGMAWREAGARGYAGR